MKFKFQPYVVIAAIMIVVFASLMYLKQRDSPMTHYDLYGSQITFRQDLREAQNISIYPDEQSIFDAAWNPDLERVKIVFPFAENSSIIKADAFEIAFKLGLMYNKQGWYVVFDSALIESYDDLRTTNSSLTIALIPPKVANETKVMIGNKGVVYISGTTDKDFDLATMRFLMAALKITV